MKVFEKLSRTLVNGGLGLAALVFAGLSTPAQAMLVDLQLVVNVIQVCDDAGANCAATGPAGNAYFEAEADKIWAQAGIDIKFVAAGTLNSSALLTGASGVTDFAAIPLGGTGTTMWLVDDLLCSGCTLFGEAWLDSGGAVINMGATMAYNGGAGRLDTIAHELGHNLGIDHDDADFDYLMASGANRNTPGSLGDICPDGLCYDLLSAAHIANARDSDLLIPLRNAVPEPGSLALAGLTLLALGTARRTRRGR